jgi:hypothetical protein
MIGDAPRSENRTRNDPAQRKPYEDPCAGVEVKIKGRVMPEAKHSGGSGEAEANEHHHNGG